MRVIAITAPEHEVSRIVKTAQRIGEHDVPVSGVLLTVFGYDAMVMTR